jgi:DNA-binding NarL/FixJ family response regulator
MAERLLNARPASPDTNSFNEGFHDLPHFFPTIPFATRTLETSVNLTPREKELLLLISLSWENEEIAEGLGISWSTVKNINNGLFSKLGVNTRTEVAITALTDGLIDASELKTVYADQINCLEEGTLTVRQTEVLKLISRGLFNKEIARELYISMPVVRNHITIILRRLKGKNRTEITMAYLLSNLSPSAIGGQA